MLSSVVVGGLLWWGLLLAYLRNGPDGKAPQPAAALPYTLTPVS